MEDNTTSDTTKEKLSMRDYIKMTVSREKQKFQSIGKAFFEDQYHFGSIELTNPTRDHYIFGVSPKTILKGNNEDNIFRKIKTFGLILSRFKAEDNTIIGDITTHGILYSGNSFGNDCRVNRSAVAGLVGNTNTYGGRCVIDESTARGIFNVNNYGANCKIKKCSKAQGLFNLHITPKKTKFGLLETSVINQD